MKSPSTNRGPITRSSENLTTRLDLPPARQGPSTINPQPSTDIYDIARRLQDNFQQVQRILDRIQQSEENTELQLAAAAELRQHIALAEKTLESTRRLEAQAHLEQAVIEVLEETSPRLRKKVIDKLNERAQTQT